ncbi:head-tail adaptor protein [Streptococcus cuniculi]|uniref:Head-tail adaptor protein n=1 Tax=Streptococcus cuniculi TaxID=1432788 RepID=A0A4Y9J975_9STRE|nr:head-tail adaptor protein [Streptococcus cuniculi]MBF0778713.1 head-tail adaptor protein [Streptococcus cuniculi]TFU97347.1 head-tail adaptor protein [Streptococcus cuniculi]
MKIAPLRERLTFQVCQIVQDEIGNESSMWISVFERWCSARPLALTESDGSATKFVHNKVQFILRYDKAVFALNSLTIRVSFRDQIYTIDSIDGDSVPRTLIYIVATKEESHD